MIRHAALAFSLFALFSAAPPAFAKRIVADGVAPTVALPARVTPHTALTASMRWTLLVALASTCPHQARNLRVCLAPHAEAAR